LDLRSQVALTVCVAVSFDAQCHADPFSEQTAIETFAESSTKLEIAGCAIARALKYPLNGLLLGFGNHAFALSLSVTKAQPRSFDQTIWVGRQACLQSR
jgi:hypothetical protein